MSLSHDRGLRIVGYVGLMTSRKHITARSQADIEIQRYVLSISMYSLIYRSQLIAETMPVFFPSIAICIK